VTIALALLMPLVFGVLVILALAWLLVRLFRLLRKRRHSPAATRT
jgi:NhaP-type Na+/H+ or K+/H+ antiporter